MYHHISYFLSIVAFSVALTCDEIKETKGGAGSTTNENLMSLKPLEVDSCLAELGKDRLQPEQGRILWSLFTQVSPQICLLL